MEEREFSNWTMEFSSDGSLGLSRSSSTTLWVFHCIFSNKVYNSFPTKTSSSDSFKATLKQKKTSKCHLHQTLGFLVEKYPSSCKLRSWKTADSTRTVFSLSDMLLRCPTWFTTGWQLSKIYVFISLSPGWKLSESTQAPRDHHLENQVTQIPHRLPLWQIVFLELYVSIFGIFFTDFENSCFDFLHLLDRSSASGVCATAL